MFPVYRFNAKTVNKLINNAHHWWRTPDGWWDWYWPTVKKKVMWRRPQPIGCRDIHHPRNSKDLRAGGDWIRGNRHRDERRKYLGGLYSLCFGQGWYKGPRRLCLVTSTKVLGRRCHEGWTLHFLETQNLSDFYSLILDLGMRDTNLSFTTPLKKESREILA